MIRTLLIVVCLVALPTIVYAQNFFGPIVPQCAGGECQACHLVQLADNIIDFLISIFAVIGAILVAWAGLLMATSAGNMSQRDRGKSILQNAIIGLVIMLVAWLVVDTIMKTLAGSEAYGMWREIQCVEIEEYRDDPTITLVEEGPETGFPPEEVIIPPTEEGGGGGGGLVNYGGYKFKSSVVGKMKFIADTYHLRVSSGYRTVERNREVNGAENSWHLTGRAGDFVGPRTNMEAAATWARTNGAKEVLIHNAGSGTHLHVVF